MVTLWRHHWRHQHEKYFSLIICIWSFHFWYLIGAILNSQNFCKVTKFLGRANFFVKRVTGRMLYLPDSQGHFLHFELLIEVLAKKLTELWQFQNLAYFLTWWPSFVTYLFVHVTCRNQWPSTYVDPVWWWCQGVRELCMKMRLFHLKMNIEGWLCRHAVTSSVMSSAWKYFSRIICIWSFHFWYLIGAILNSQNFSIVSKFWGRNNLFHQKCHRKYVILTR